MFAGIATCTFFKNPTGSDSRAAVSADSHSAQTSGLPHLKRIFEHLKKKEK
jgi:hypothetical protein